MSTKIDEGEWLDLVDRIEKAMAIHPFMPRQEDVITLLSMAVNGNQHMLRVEDLERLLAERQFEIDGYRARVKTLEARLDQILTLANLE